MMDEPTRAPTMVEANMGDTKVKETTGADKRILRNKLPVRQGNVSKPGLNRTIKPQTATKPESASGLRASTTTLTIPTIAVKSKSFIPAVRKQTAIKEQTNNDDPMRASRSSMIPTPSSKFQIDRSRSKSNLELIISKGPTKPPPINNNTNSFVSLNKSKLSSTCSRSIFHRPGTLPGYLSKPNQLNLESLLSEKQRKFVLSKKVLVESQEQCKQQFNEIAELNARLSRFGGKQSKLEKMQLMYLVPSDDGASAVERVDELKPVKTTCDQSIGTENEDLDVTLVDPVMVKPNVASCIDQSTLLLVENQLRSTHSVPFTFCTENISNYASLSKLLSKISAIEELPPIVTKLERFYLNCEMQMVKAQDDQLQKIDTFLEQLRDQPCKEKQVNNDKKQKQAALIVQKRESIEIADTTTEHHSKIIILKAELDNLTEVHRALQVKHDKLIGIMKENELCRENESEVQQQEMQALQKTHDMLIKTTEKEKIETNKALQKQKQDLTDASDQLKYELVVLRLEADKIQHSLSNALSKIDKLTTSNKAAEQNCEQLRDKIAKLESERSSMQNNFETIISQEKEKHEYLSAELNSARLQLAVQCTKPDHSDLQRLEQQLQVLQLENAELRTESADLVAARQQLTTETARAEQYELQVEKLQRQIRHKCSTLHKLKQDIELDEQNTLQLRQDYEQLKESHDQQTIAFSLVQQKLNDSQTLCHQHEETIAMHQRILRIRSELIGVLRRKGESTRCRMVDLYAEVGKKSTIVNKMDHEISAREEEMHNLFSTLSTKQMEVSRQDQLIKMLEECNAHNLMIRGKQFERISQLEKEKTELKKRLVLCRGGELGLTVTVEDTETETLLSPDSFDVAFNRDMHCEERRKKRREKSAIVKPKVSNTRLKRDHSESKMQDSVAKLKKQLAQ